MKTPDNDHQEHEDRMNQAANTAMREFMNLTAGELVRRGLLSCDEGSELWQAWREFADERLEKAQEEFLHGEVVLAWREFIDRQGGEAVWQKLTEAQQKERVDAEIASKRNAKS